MCFLCLVFYIISFFSVNSNYIDESGKIPEDLIQDLKDMGLFGRMMPKKYGNYKFDLLLRTFVK